MTIVSQNQYRLSKKKSLGVLTWRWLWQLFFKCLYEMSFQMRKHAFLCRKQTFLGNKAPF